jgi:hypothetical protein
MGGCNGFSLVYKIALFAKSFAASVKNRLQMGILPWYLA